MGRIFEKFCPECLEVTTCSIETQEKTFRIRGEKVTIQAEYVRCGKCNNLIPDLDRDERNYRQAYDIYRKLKNLLFPDDIVNIRKKYGLSQRTFAKLLGWSHATLSHYESGALQSISHNNELILLGDPENMIRLLETNKTNLTTKKLSRIRKNLDHLLNSIQTERLDKVINEYFSTFQPDIFTGFRRCTVEKIIEAIKFFSVKDKELLKVKLMKYLWYSDFLHFKRHTVSITGLKYIHAPFGPVPDHHELLLHLTTKEGVVEEPCPVHDYVGTKYIAHNFNERLFTPEEFETMSDVFARFKDFNSSALSQYSHKEKAYLDTAEYEYIAYDKAETLSID